MMTWIKWATEYTVGAAVVLAHLARSGRGLRYFDAEIDLDDRPRRRAPRLLN
jgi:hypothetical protein